MTDSTAYRSTRTAVPARRAGDSLADILERVLDKGVVVAGDIQVNLLDIELLTLKVGLLVASVDTARDMGIDWWAHDPFLTGRPRESDGLEARMERLEKALEKVSETISEKGLAPQLPRADTEAGAAARKLASDEKPSPQKAYQEPHQELVDQPDGRTARQ